MRRLSYAMQAASVLFMVALIYLIGWSMNAHAYRLIPIQVILMAINIVVFFSQFAIRRRLGP